MKSAWDTYSSQEVDKHRLGKETIHEMLKNRTKSLVDRIDRNIRIGMVILFGFIGFVLFGDSYLSEILMNEIVEYPAWLNFIDVFTSFLIVTTYLFFVISYFRIKRNFSCDTQLKDLLTGILDTLKIYHRMFYLAVVILLINMVVSFTAGLFQGVKFNTNTGRGIENLTTSKILIITGVDLVILIPFIAITFFLLRWGFNRLYGRYLIRLNETLHELDESESAE